MTEKYLKKAMHCVSLSVITTDSIMNMGIKYYCQVYLEKCKYVVKQNEMQNVTGAELQLHSSDDVDGFYSE